jgi:threonyl-tRNA synthetase
MMEITLPDGSIKKFKSALSCKEVAKTIGARLAKDALVVKVNGELRDLDFILNQDAKIEVLTSKNEESLEILRHDMAHIMAEAVKELYPKTQVTIGPAIDDGFYYDFSRKDPFTPDDLKDIEKRMHEIIKRDEKIVREVWDRDKAVSFFKKQGEKYKAEIISEIPKDEEITLYRQGDFIDLCRGPHFPSTARVGSFFKLMKISGAYWKGDSENEMLQRIYGTAWFTKKDLETYLQRLEEAEKRDHRKLGKDMDLFHFQEEAPGAVFWHPKGWELFQTLVNYIRKKQTDSKYMEISTPTVMDRKLWEKSGHWETFRENMYITETEDGRIFALKPMNCPGGIQIFKQGLRSYRELPLRISEFGKVNRYEASGALQGLMRVREFTQDDAHIFCSQDQMQSECREVIELVIAVYRELGFEDIDINFADRPDKRIGSDEKWSLLEGALTKAIDDLGLKYKVNTGEGAFYGPKLEFVLKDAIGRKWQCGTLQVDMFLPERLDANFIGEDGEKHKPVLLHRALFGSLERFIGILLEHYAGKLPLWLSPTQIVVATITSDADKYANLIFDQASSAGLSIEVDSRNEKIGYKVREHSLAKTPIMFVVGKKEAENKTVTIRKLGSDKQDTMKLDSAIQEIVKKSKLPSSMKKK